MLLFQLSIKITFGSVPVRKIIILDKSDVSNYPNNGMVANLNKYNENIGLVNKQINLSEIMLFLQHKEPYFFI